MDSCSSAGGAVGVITSWHSVVVLWEDVLDVVVGVVRVIKSVEWVSFPVVLLLWWEGDGIDGNQSGDSDDDVFHFY